MVEHALFREYPDVAPGKDLSERALAMLHEAADRFAALIAGWLRVGFCQGNFNADNCLVSGRTMDYGPFGWIDVYDPLFAKWVGSGQHFAFMNQPSAALANYATLVSALMPVLGDDATSHAQSAVQRARDKITSAAEDVFRIKMGFSAKGSPAAGELWQDWEPLLRRSEFDYTIFWRQLATVAELSDSALADDSKVIAAVKPAAYGDLRPGLMEEWVKQLLKWRDAVSSEQDGGGLTEVASRLRAANPKYIPREWMLVEAYDQAAAGKYDLVHELYKLFTKPYDEQPEFEARYYRPAPAQALRKGGVARMT